MIYSYVIDDARCVYRVQLKQLETSTIRWQRTKIKDEKKTTAENKTNKENAGVFFFLSKPQRILQARTEIHCENTTTQTSASKIITNSYTIYGLFIETSQTRCPVSIVVRIFCSNAA